MDKATLPIYIFVAVSALAAVMCHLFFRRVYLASILAGIISSILFQIGAYIDLGYLDPFAPVAFIFGAAYAAAIALFVGVLFYLFRRQKS